MPTDQLAIRTVLDEYCLRLEVARIDDWLEPFTEDTVYQVYKLSLKGHARVREVIGQAPHGVHVGGAVRITIDGDTAETIQNYVFVSTSTDDWNAGWQHRTLVRTPAGWKIAHTKFRFARKDPLPQNAGAAALAYPITFGD